LSSLVSISQADAIWIHGQAMVVSHAAQQVEVFLIVSAEFPLADKLAGCGTLTCASSHTVENLKCK
jgi:hypothetical protein